MKTWNKFSWVCFYLRYNLYSLAPNTLLDDYQYTTILGTRGGSDLIKVFNFRTSSWKKICCAENFVAVVGKLYQQLQYPSQFYSLFKGMVIQTTEEGLSITIHARTLLLQFKESTTLTVGSFDATPMSRRRTFFSRASQSLQWYLVKGNTILSLPSLFRFYFFSQRRYTTKLSTITRIISESFSFTDKRNNIYAVSIVTSTRPLVSYIRTCRSVSYCHGY